MNGLREKKNSSTGKAGMCIYKSKLDHEQNMVEPHMRVIQTDNASLPATGQLKWLHFSKIMNK